LYCTARANSASTSRGLRIQRTVRVFSIRRPVSRRRTPRPTGGPAPAISTPAAAAPTTTRVPGRTSRHHLSGHDWPGRIFRVDSFMHAKGILLRQRAWISQSRVRLLFPPRSPLSGEQGCSGPAEDGRSSSLRLATRESCVGLLWFSLRAAGAGRQPRTGKRARSVLASARGFPNHPLFPLSSRHLRTAAGPLGRWPGRGRGTFWSTATIT